MPFVKGQKPPQKKVEEKPEVTPILDKETSEANVSKEEMVQRVMQAQSTPPEPPKVREVESVKEIKDFPDFLKGRKHLSSVKLLSIGKKYRDKPFMSCPPFSNSKRKYLTGQEDLTPEELAKQPIIIDPFGQYPIVHNLVLYPDKEDDKVMLNYYKNVVEVAVTKSSIIPGISLFYIENREEEAEQEIVFSRQVFEAMDKVRKCSLSKMLDIVLMLGLDSNSLTQIQAENLLWKECQKSPKNVLDQFRDGKEDELFIRKLIKSHILTHRIGEGVYERIGEGQNMFLGKTIIEAVKFIREPNNVNYAVRWGNILRERGIK